MCPWDRSSRVVGLSYKYYKSISDLLGHILANVYDNLQQDGSNPWFANPKIVMVIRNDMNMERLTQSQVGQFMTLPTDYASP